MSDAYSLVKAAHKELIEFIKFRRDIDYQAQLDAGSICLQLDEALCILQAKTQPKGIEGTFETRRSIWK